MLLPDATPTPILPLQGRGRENKGDAPTRALSSPGRGEPTHPPPPWTRGEVGRGVARQEPVIPPRRRDLPPARDIPWTSAPLPAACAASHVY